MASVSGVRARSRAATGENVMNYLHLLAVLGRIPPEAWDAIVPHGPAIGRVTKADRVGFNPQPDPPGSGFVVGAAELAHEIVRIVVAGEVRGESAASLMSDVIDDWCGTGWPRKFPFPVGPWPDPDPSPWLETYAPLGQLAGAVVLASAATRLRDEKLGRVLADGAERLARTALPEKAAVTRRRK